MNTKSLRHSILVLCTAAIIGLSGCTSFNVQPEGSFVSSAPEVTFQAYRQVQDKIVSDNIVALISYTASDMQKTKLGSWAAYRALLDREYDMIKATKRIAPNYPVNPSGTELQLWKQFTDTWMAEAIGSRINPAAGKQAFSSSAASFVFKVINNEYKR